MQDFRDSAIELVEDGMVEPMDMLKACLCYMSQDDVRDMLEANDLGDARWLYSLRMRS